MAVRNGGVAVVGCLLAVSALSAPAFGHVASREAFSPLAGPVLAGSQLAWGRPTRGHGVALVETVDGSPSIVQTFPANATLDEARAGGLGPYAPSYTATLAASGQRAAVQIDAPNVGGGDSGQAIYGGPLGQPLNAMADCLVPPGQFAPSISLDGHVMAYRGPQCGTASVSDLGASPAATTVLPSDALLLRVSGPYVAYVTGGGASFPSPDDSIEVLNWQTRQVLYRVSPSAVGGEVYDLSLQADGKVLFSFGVSGRSRPPFEAVAWASPAQPRAHRLLGLGELQEGVLVGDRAVILTRSVTSADGGSTLRLVDLSGHTRLLARDVRSRGFTRTFDFDGSDVTWLSHSCTAVLVNRAPLTAMTGGGSPPHCALALTMRPQVVGRSRIRLGISCRGFEADCSVARVTIRAGSRKRSMVLGHLPTGYLGGQAPFTVPLTRAGRRWLKAHEHGLVQVAGFIGDAPSDSGSNGALRRSRLVQLR